MTEPMDLTTDRRQLLRAAGGTAGVLLLASGVPVAVLGPRPAHAQSGGFPPDLPEPWEDPPFIEGPYGGPATPFNGHPSAGHDGVKDDTGDVGGALETLGGIATTVGKILTLTGVGGGAGVTLTTVGNGLKVAGGVLDLITGDPPKPYEEVVRFEKRISNPPGAQHPAGRRIAVYTQSTVFTTVTARGLLAAMERTAGAIQAGDLDWAIAHHGTFMAAREQLARDLATVAVAGHSVAMAVAGSPLDIQIDASEAAGVKDWLAEPAVVSQLESAGKAAGLTEREIAQAIASYRTEGPRGLPESPARWSQLVLSETESLYGRAVEMHEEALVVGSGA